MPANALRNRGLTIGQIASRTGLAPSASRYYEDERPVLTPSRWQVRSPIYKGAVQRWKRYGDALQPLISALGDELEGYTNG